MKELSRKGQIIEKPTDALKRSTVLEFLDLREDERYSEPDLENAIINKIEHDGQATIERQHDRK